MIPTIKLTTERNAPDIYILQPFHFDLLNRNNGLLTLSESRTLEVMILTMRVNINRLYREKFGKNEMPIIHVADTAPVFSRYSEITFIESFGCFDMAAQYIQSLDDINDLPPQDVCNNIINLYKEQDPNALFYCSVLHEKYHNIKGYFAYINNETANCVFWTYDSRTEEHYLDEEDFLVDE